MIDIVKIQTGSRIKECLSYNKCAFTTAKGTFTLTGTSSDWIDTFKNLDTGEFHEYPRSHIKKWLDQGKIQPVPESTRLDWHQKSTWIPVRSLIIDYNTEMEHRYHSEN